MKELVIIDADVDAADLHLITAPTVKERHEFQGGHTAIINKDKCTQCALCQDLCRWDAISDDFEIDAIACEGCGVCVYLCPEQAVDFPLNTCGEWFVSDTAFGPMVHARLGIAEENSGKLVSLVRRKAKELAGEKNLDLILTDGPPGVGCPVIAAVGGASGVLIVTEPTVSGKHDMERVVRLADHFNVPAMVCVNKFDLNLEQSQAIESIANDRNVGVLGRIPFDSIFTQSMVQGQTIFEYNGESEAGRAVKQIWEEIRKILGI